VAPLAALMERLESLGDSYCNMLTRCFYGDEDKEGNNDSHSNPDLNKDRNNLSILDSAITSNYVSNCRIPLQHLQHAARKIKATILRCAVTPIVHKMFHITSSAQSSTPSYPSTDPLINPPTPSNPYTCPTIPLCKTDSSSLIIKEPHIVTLCQGTKSVIGKFSPLSSSSVKSPTEKVSPTFPQGFKNQVEIPCPMIQPEFNPVNSLANALTKNFLKGSRFGDASSGMRRLEFVIRVRKTRRIRARDRNKAENIQISFIYFYLSIKTYFNLSDYKN
jgi:hypothetical protein